MTCGTWGRRRTSTGWLTSRSGGILNGLTHPPRTGSARSSAFVILAEALMPDGSRDTGDEDELRRAMFNLGVRFVAVASDPGEDTVIGTIVRA